jgi:hypothetical protein
MRDFAFFAGIWSLGALVGALLMYMATGFLGPPDFDTMRRMAAYVGCVPGIAVLSWAAYRYFTLGYKTFGVSDSLKASGVLLVVLPLTAWLAYPYLHQRIGQATGGWEWQCSARGCEWSRAGASPTSTLPQPTPGFGQKRR